MSIPTKHKIVAYCPGCNNEIYFKKHPKLGEFVTCPECGDLVEVVSLSPLTLDWSPDVEDEDWQDYWNDDVDETADFDDFMDDYDD